MARSSSSLCRWRERAPSFATPAWCPSISTARRRSAASSDCNLCALGDPVVCLFTLDGAPTRHLEGPRVFSGVHNVNIFFALFALVSLGVAVASPPEQLSDFALSDQNSVFRRNSFQESLRTLPVANRHRRRGGRLHRSQAASRSGACALSKTSYPLGDA